MVNNLGIMQGRLTRPYTRGIQFFPHDQEWQNEFFVAKDLGLNYIEWIITDNKNPFLGNFSDSEKIKNAINSSNVKIKSICLDYLMDLDLNDGRALAYATDSLNWISNIASNIGCKMIVIPIYKKNMNRFHTSYLISNIVADFKVAFEFLDSHSHEGIDFINSLNFFDLTNIGCCFDIGNNYDKDVISEIKNYNKYGIFHIHIKDKNEKGETVPLGNGVTNWEKVFETLEDIGYNGSYTLQVAREEDGKEKETINNQIKFIKRLL